MTYYVKVSSIGIKDIFLNVKDDFVATGIFDTLKKIRIIAAAGLLREEVVNENRLVIYPGFHCPFIDNIARLLGEKSFIRTKHHPVAHTVVFTAKEKDGLTKSYAVSELYALGYGDYVREDMDDPSSPREAWITYDKFGYSFGWRWGGDGEITTHHIIEIVEEHYWCKDDKIDIDLTEDNIYTATLLAADAKRASDRNTSHTDCTQNSLKNCW